MSVTTDHEEITGTAGDGNGNGRRTFETSPGVHQPPTPEAAPVAKDEKAKRGTFLYFICAILAIFAFLVIAYFVLFGGSSSQKTNIPVNGAPTATTTRSAETAQDAREKAAEEIKQIVGTPTTTPQTTTQTEASRTGLDPLNQPVSPYGSTTYAPNGTLMNQPIVPSTGPASDTTSTQTTANNSTGANGGGSSNRTSEKADKPEQAEPTASTQTSYYYFNRDRERQSATPQFLTAGGLRDSSASEATDSAPVKPPFITRLPVRVQSAISTLTTGSTVTFELVRPMKGAGWSLPRGTIFVGTTASGAGDRAYVKIEGFIDPQNPERMVAMGGEALGRDGAAGLMGQRKRLGAGWVRSLKKFGKQMGNASVGLGAALLLGRGGGGATYYNPQQDPFGVNTGENNQAVEFVYVPGNSFGYIIVNDRPPTVQGAVAKPPETTPTPEGGITEEEMIQLMTTGTAEQLRAALPRMNQQQRAIVEDVLRGQQ